MATFSTLVSQFAHENGQGSNDGRTNNQDKKRARPSSSSIETSGSARHTTEQEEVLVKKDEQEDSDKESLSTRVRKSLRLSAASSSNNEKNVVSNNSSTVSRVVSATSIKSRRPHHTRQSVAVTAASSSSSSSSSSNVKIEENGQPAVEVKIENNRPKGRPNGYAPPEVYAHLSYVTDIIDNDLDVLWVGINPGVRSSLLPPGVRLTFMEDQLMLQYRMGLTNLVDRPSRSGSELSAIEARAAAPVLMAKIKKYRPRFVCFVSKQAWDMFAGVGLGLQTAWVSWYDEDEDDALNISTKEEPGLQYNLNAQGYRMSPYFEQGPSAVKLEQDLAAEGVPSPFGSDKYRAGFVKREEDLAQPKREEEEEDVKTEMDVDVKVKVEVKVKEEGDEDEKKVKLESHNGVVDYGNDKGKGKATIKSEDEKELKSEKKERDHSTGPPSWPRRGVVRGSRMFVMPSTSGRVTQYRKEDKLAYFKQLAALVHRDRQLRGLE
ncbi:hypothetical protein BGZ94_008981 [Podila epigama]|nr:hypothetical protein BGZ94_008981 [Podila epigama]